MKVGVFAYAGAACADRDDCTASEVCIDGMCTPDHDTIATAAAASG